MHTHTGHQSLSALGSHTLLAVATLTIMVGCVIVPGLPAVAAQLGVGSGGSWLVTLPALGVVLFGPAAARLMERAGLRRALMLGLFLYGLLGAAGPYLRGAWLIYADRLLLGGATALVMAAGTGLISTFYTGRARLAMIARQGMAIELGGVLFLFAGGLLAQQRWSLPFALYLCAWALLALVHFCVPVTAVAAPTFAASTAAPASATPTVSTAPRHGGPTAAAAAMPAQVKTAFAAALLSMVAFFAGIIMLPARLAGLGVDEAGTGYFLSFISLVAVGGAALLPALGRRASGRACWSPRCWPTRPPTAVSPWRSRPRNGRRCWRAPCCMDWDSACRFRCSTTWSSNIAPTARGPSSGVPVHGHLLRPVPVFLHGIPARRARRRIRRRRPDFIAVGRRLRARDGPPAPLPVTTEDTRAMELSQASLLLDPAPCNWKPALNGCPTACCTWPAAPICTTARARCSNGGSARVPARASTSGGTPWTTCPATGPKAAPIRTWVRSIW